jgi:hypothetical protein
MQGVTNVYATVEKARSVAMLGSIDEYIILSK